MIFENSCVEKQQLLASTSVCLRTLAIMWLLKPGLLKQKYALQVPLNVGMLFKTILLKTDEKSVIRPTLKPGGLLLMHLEV